MTERVDDIQALAFFHLGQATGAVTYNLDEECKGATDWVDVVHRYGTAQHYFAYARHLHFDKLAGLDRLHLSAVTEHKDNILRCRLASFKDGEFMYFFHSM